MRESRSLFASGTKWLDFTAEHAEFAEKESYRQPPMQEGWHENQYLILFDQGEIAAVSDRYQISRMLPGYEIVGLCDWDDFIVRDKTGHTFSIPAVVPQMQHLSPFVLPNDRTVLNGDPRFAGKIKWYVKPILFGGNPDSQENETWVSHEQHAQLVRWWCEVYRELKTQNSDVSP